jgi:hypothetical protein
MADLRPMEFGEILDGALSLFRRHFRLFLKLSLTVMWLPIAMLLYWRVRFIGLQGAPEQAAALVRADIVPFILWILVWAVVYGFGMLLLTAGSIRIISDSYLGREPRFGDALALGFSKIVPLFLVGVGKSLLLTLLFFLGAVVIGVCVALGKVVGVGIAILATLAALAGTLWLVLYVASGYMVTTPVVVLEALPSAFDSFARSWELTRQARWKVFGLVFVGYLLASLLPSIVLSVMGELVKEIAPAGLLPWTVVSAAVPILLAPMIPCILTLGYYDLRVRREAFDLQLLGEQLGIS